MWRRLKAVGDLTLGARPAELGNQGIEEDAK